jgi:hypothetical protein
MIDVPTLKVALGLPSRNGFSSQPTAGRSELMPGRGCLMPQLQLIYGTIISVAVEYSLGDARGRLATHEHAFHRIGTGTRRPRRSVCDLLVRSIRFYRRLSCRLPPLINHNLRPSRLAIKMHDSYCDVVILEKYLLRPDLQFACHFLSLGFPAVTPGVT